MRTIGTTFMRMCVCVCVCACVCMCMCMCAYMHACVCACVYACMCVQLPSTYISLNISVIPNLSGTAYPIMRPINVAVEGVASLLANLDPSKASGPDGIPARFLKDMANDLAPSLTLIYQASLTYSR